MKRSMKAGVALVVSALVLLTSSPSTVQAQTTATTDPVGFITLSITQVLRITVVNANKNRTATVRFGHQTYSKAVCVGGLCKLVVAAQATSAPLSLMPGEAASFDIPSTDFAVRGVVSSSGPDLQVSAMVVDSATGEVEAALPQNYVGVTN